jgi:type IV pilus assembly protein PilW
MRTRGFSLIELLIAVAISAVIIAGGVSLLIGTQRFFQGGVDDRAMQEAARVALESIRTNLQRAGYGMEPTFALDFGQALTTMDRIPLGLVAPPTTQPVVTASPYAWAGGYDCADGKQVVCRDSTTGPDELVFYAREPMFQRYLNGAATSDGFTLQGPAPAGGWDGGFFQSGQILQVMCYGIQNEWSWAYVSVDKVDSTGHVTLQGGTAKKYDFPFQNELLNRASFATSEAAGARRAFLINRYRYFVAAVDAAGNIKDWETAGTRPYLMLDQGFTDSDKNPIYTPIAADVEDIQFAYIFPQADTTTSTPSDPADPDSDPIFVAQIVGADPGTPVTNNILGIDLDPARGIPALTSSSRDPVRSTLHPANIRAVRIAVTVRTERQDSSSADSVIPKALNRPKKTDGEAGYHRMTFETTVRLPNMDAQIATFPNDCVDDPKNCDGNL